MENLIEWEWVNVFWISWFFLVTLAFYLVGLFILLCLTCYYYLSGEADKFQIVGLFWCFNEISNFALGLFLVLIGALKILNKQGDGNNLIGY